MKKFRLNRRDIELIGVAHHPNTMKVPEYKEKLKSAILNASLIVLEAVPTIFNNRSKESIKQLVCSLDFLADFSNEELDLLLEKNINNNPYLDFLDSFKELQLNIINA